MYNFKRRAQQQVPQQQQEEEEEFALVEEEQPEEAQVDKNDYVHVNTNNNNDDTDKHNAEGDNSVDLPLHHTQDVITAINNNEELQLANAQVVNETEPSLAHDADERTVLMYYRQEVQKHLLVPPRPWRQIRLDLPSTVAELQLYPPQPEMVQYAEPIIPSPCIVILLDGTKPAEMNNNEYMAQMVNYLFELLRYQNASTAMTMVRFVKRGSELSQLVVTFGQDIPLATRVLVELQSAGLAAGFGQPIHDHPPNATFQIIDYKMIMHDGVGITEEDIQLLLEPFRQSDQGDMVVIEGYEPGVYYAPVKRPETVFTFLWNPFCSFLLQSGLFEKYGVLITMAYCPHEFLTKGMPFYLQRKQKEVEQAPNEKLENQVQGAAVISPSPSEEPVRITEEQQKETQLLVDVNSNNKNSYNNDNAQSDADVDVYGEKEQYEPWLDRARDEIDIFDTHTENLTESKVASLSFNARHNPVKSNQTAGALVLNDEDEEEDEDNVFHSNNNQTNVPEQNKFYGSNNDTQHHNVYNVNNNIGSFNNQNQFYSNGSNSVNNNVNNEDYGSHQFSSSSFTMTGNRDNYMTPQAPHNIPLIPPMQFNLDPTLSSLPEQPSSYLPQMNTFDSSNYSNNMNTVSTSLINNQPMIHDAQRTQEPILPDISSEPTNITLYNPQQELSMIPLNDNAHEHFDKPILSETPQQPQQIKEKREVVVEGVQSQTTTLQENEYSNMQLPFTTPTPHYSIPYAPVPFTQPQHQWMPSEFPIPLSSLSSSSLSTFTFANNAPLPYALPTLPSHTFPNMEQPNANGPNMPYITSTPSLQAWNNINNNSYNYNYGSNINNQFVPQAFQPQTQIQQQQLPLSSLSEENVPLAMTVEDAKALIEEIEEQIHIAFVEFKSFHEGTDNDETCALLEMSPEQVVQYNNNASTSELLPYTSAIHVLMQLITASHDRIQFLLQSTETEFTELQMQLAQLLLGDATSVVQERQNQNNSPQENKEEFKEEGEEEEEKKKEEEPRNACNNRIALLPYLLRTQEGVYIASTLAAYYTDKLSHVLIRYVMLYLCQTNIIQTIVLPCLANDSNPHNPLVERLMRYWVVLAMWVHNYIALQAEHEASTELPRQRQLKPKMWNNYTMQSTEAFTNESTAHNDKMKEMLVNTATKRLLSQVGNALESMMAVMSVKQRSWCKEYSECNNSITSFKEQMLQSTLRKKSNTNEEPHDVEILTEDDVDTIQSMRMLWELDGAAWRTLLRLYLNADILNGEQLALVLFSNVAWTKELYYFVLSTTIPSQVSQSLNLETARFCGTFLRMFEEKMLEGSAESPTASSKKEEEQESSTTTNNGNNNNNKAETHVQENVIQVNKDCPLVEKNATELVQSALGHIVFPHIYEAFQRAYELNRVNHFNSVMNLLSLPPPLPPQPPPPFPVKFNKYNRVNAHYSQQEHKTKKSEEQEREEVENNYNKSKQTNDAVSQSTNTRNKDINTDHYDKNKERSEQHSKEEIELENSPRWRSEWSTIMSTYPASGDPFPPLPPNWRSALSRSYGHYYFISSNSNNNNKPTYKHPVSKKEYMATPQAFVKAFSKEITLPRIQAHALAELKRIRDEESSSSNNANKDVNKITTPPQEEEKECKDEKSTVEVEVTEPTQLMVNQWWHDQRIRHVSLDTAVMDLLKITYRVGKSSNESNKKEEKVNGKEELRECLRVLDRYPISGAPFPPLSGDNWSVKMDTENGMYVFHSDSVPSTLLHPRTHRMYRVSPQAFAELHSLSVDDIAQHSQCSVREIEHWLGDQSYRRSAIDYAVVEMIPINYTWYDELDKSYKHKSHYRGSSRHERSDNYHVHLSSQSRHDSRSRKYRREENNVEYDDNRPSQRHRSEHDSAQRYKSRRYQ